MCTGVSPWPDPADVAVQLMATWAFTGAIGVVTADSLGRVAARAIDRRGWMLTILAVAVSITALYAGINWLVHDPAYIRVVRSWVPVVFVTPAVIGFAYGWRAARQPAWVAAILATVTTAGAWAGLIWAMGLR